MRETKNFIDLEGGKMKIYNMAAFSDNKSGGNLAGVVLDSDSFTREEMQNIAKKIGYSETAFVMPQGEDFGLRWFTPASEIDLCGHATLATAFVLKNCTDFGKDVLPLLINKMYGYTINEYLLDVGTMANYEKAQREWQG